MKNTFNLPNEFLFRPIIINIYRQKLYLIVCEGPIMNALYHTFFPPRKRANSRNEKFRDLDKEK